MKTIILMIFLTLLVLASCAEKIQVQTTTSEETVKEAYIRTTNVEVEEPIKKQQLKIISPKDEQLVKGSNVTIKLEAENFNIVPVGSPVKENEGHFHVWFDSIKKLGPQKEFTFENIASGRHSIVAELVTSNHSSFSPRITETILINVESDYIPEEEFVKSGIREYTVEATDSYFHPSRIQARINDTVIIHFTFKDNAIYFNGLDITGPFPDIQYRLKGQQPITTNFTVLDETKISSWWPKTRAKKADLIVEIMK